jgi:hypothetical protein
MLHIHNGDSTANKMKEAEFPGEHFAFREALATGPAPRGLMLWLGGVHLQDKGKLWRWDGQFR